MSDEYSEEDIAKALNYLRFNDPENATRDGAINLLRDLKSGFHSMAHRDPDLLLKLKRELDNKSSLKT